MSAPSEPPTVIVFAPGADGEAPAGREDAAELGQGAMHCRGEEYGEVRQHAVLSGVGEVEPARRPSGAR